MPTHYHEPRRLTSSGWTAIAALSAAAVYGLVDGGLSADNVLAALGVPAVLLVFVLAFGSSRWGSEFQTVTVDDRGLTVGRVTLPADDIGAASPLPHEAAFWAAPRGKLSDGTKISRSSFGPIATRDDAVVVTVRSAPRPSVWLVATRDPDALVLALDAVCTSARR